MPQCDDQYLVALAVASQDTAAFGELIRRHQSQVRNFLRRFTGGSLADADDLAQETFLRAWEKLHTYSGSGSFIGWLLKVAYRTFLQSKRKSKRYGEILDEAGHIADLQSPGHATDSHEVSDLEKLMTVLDEQERAVLVMSYACGLSHREISDATGQPVGTIKSVIYRSKEKIRTSFDIKDHQHG